MRGNSLVELGEENRPGEKCQGLTFGGLLQRLVALVLLILLSPLFAIVSLLIKGQDRGRVFYCGERMGKNKKPFEMYKFRTLIEGAEGQIGGALLNHKHRLQTPLGSFLRDSRIDELPQLFNVLRGDMSFFGPRPERRAVYEEHCKHIPGYDLRFRVKPGLMGYSQIFTPHSAPKRIRTIIDNRHSRRKPRFLEHLLVVAYAMLYLGLDVFNRLLRLFMKRTILLLRLRRVSERRGMDRIRPRGIVGVTLSDEEAVIEPGHVHLFDLNESHMQIRTERPLEPPLFTMRLKVDVSGRWFKQAKFKSATCTAEVVQSRRQEARLLMEPRYVYVVQYQPSSELNRYLFDKYLIRKSVL
ncbi:MAG: sugar transferase [Endozoicomonas sp.]